MKEALSSRGNYGDIPPFLDGSALGVVASIYLFRVSL